MALTRVPVVKDEPAIAELLAMPLRQADDDMVLAGTGGQVRQRRIGAKGSRLLRFLIAVRDAGDRFARRIDVPA